MKNDRNFLSRLRANLVTTGTLAIYAVSTLHADAATKPAEGKVGPLPGEAPENSEKLSEGTGQVRPDQVVHDFNVPAGPISEVMAQLEAATTVKIRIPSDRIGEVPSPGVKGVHTLAEALTEALKGTEVVAAFDSPESVGLKLRSADQSVTVTTNDLPSIKYTAPLRDLPQTLTIIPEVVLQNTASNSLVDALRTVSGITFGAGEGGNPVGDRPFIRGVDAQSSTFVDNLRDIGSQSRETFDVDSIEVAKGPSGGFAGRGASGGSININSKMARHERFGTVTFSPGSANLFRGTVDANTKLAQGVYGRLNGMAQDTGVAGRDFLHSSNYGVAPSLLFNAGNRTRIFTNYYHLNSNSTPDPGMPYNNPTFFARTDGRARVFQAGDGQPLVINRNAYYGLTSRDFRYEKVKTTFGRVEVDLKEGLVLRNSYRYGKSNQDYLYSMADDSQGNIYYGLLYRRALQRNTVVDTSIDQTDLAGHGKTGAITHNFATGFEFARERSWNGTYGLTVPVYAEPNVGGGRTLLSASRCPVGAGAAGGFYCIDLFNPTPNDPWRGAVSTGVTSTTNAAPLNYTNNIIKSTTPTRQRTITGSLYGFDTMQFLPQLQATLGIRYDHYNSAYRAAVTCVPTAAVPCSFTTVNDLVNYQAGIVYKPLKAASIYGSVSSAATPPGNALSQGQDGSAITSIVNQALPPEKTRSEEVGVKWELFSTKALVTAAYFQQDTQNVRITLADSSIAAVGKRRNRGLDTGISGYLTSKWQVFGGYTFMSAILVDAGGAGAAAGLMNGRRFPNTPEHSLAFTSYYQVNRRLSIGGGVYATGKVFGNDSPTAPKWVGAYGRVDLFGSYHFNKHVDLQANLQNVGDKTYFLQAYTTHFAQLAPGRQGRATLSYRF